MKNRCAGTAWDNSLKVLQETAEEVVEAGKKDNRLQGTFTSFRADTPRVELLIDRDQAKDRGAPMKSWRGRDSARWKNSSACSSS
jgi:multidrug efflux pump subunit AcrB